MAGAEHGPARCPTVHATHTCRDDAAERAADAPARRLAKEDRAVQAAVLTGTKGEPTLWDLPQEPIPTPPQKQCVRNTSNTDTQVHDDLEDAECSQKPTGRNIALNSDCNG
eukprot:359365-Chlamydomonas_euryale.AAC.12